MIIAEIGCGPIAGPYIEGAATHYAIDLSPESVESATDYEPRLTPRVGDARDLHFLDDNSVDLVLARNVFGDPQLGMNSAEKWMARNLRHQAIHSGDITEASAIRAAVDTHVENHKLRIIEEASRVLRPDCKLVAVEEYTPHFAAAFMLDLTLGKLSLPANLTAPIRGPIETVVPANYAKAYPDSETWHLTKR